MGLSNQCQCAASFARVFSGFFRCGEIPMIRVGRRQFTATKKMPKTWFFKKRRNKSISWWFFTSFSLIFGNILSYLFQVSNWSILLGVALHNPMPQVTRRLNRNSGPISIERRDPTVNRSSSELMRSLPVGFFWIFLRKSMEKLWRKSQWWKPGPRDLYLLLLLYKRIHYRGLTWLRKNKT